MRKKKEEEDNGDAATARQALAGRSLRARPTYKHPPMVTVELFSVYESIRFALCYGTDEVQKNSAVQTHVCPSLHSSTVPASQQAG